ncbi:MAG: S-methyl-5-thioribose-1-phosphate isomerase [Omnitrophica bacterium RIFCSPLOWO2_01_FULL_45_24]|nr:MAG: S-methyl-5-thioribose-1-phosphate isomerase [Omnitrophica bacterium RIFCSPHIGHO2_02_FULL_46_20]OGW93395.1 MAG: S-methyl-5-thioribose-1-phosphate isomerase [Omnitrophica bacterium RIFCSPLOWO2_01_FULL_45_24]OGW94399.1 MAG: S-methyl-5-thioribose-1-phosphate isomerase [Omnitrophica bacterium RIFCSPLOWO2_12_FULL_45_13]
MPVETIYWKSGKVRFINQTLLPHKLKYVSTDDIYRLWRAIKALEIRGAPALGIAGALGAIVGIKDSKAKDFRKFFGELKKVTKYIGSSRPTAINLFWALERMKGAAYRHRKESISRIKNILLKEALKIIYEDKRNCRRMARYGASLVRKGSRILTHCNAGGLATADYGTALGVLFEANKQGKRIKAYVDETRPLLQGARLTTWELMRAGIDTTLICDNMAAGIMAQGKIDMIFVGADRIAANGDAANKIGTYNLAVLAHHHKVPFYVVAPLSTFDFRIKTGKEIPIEERDGDEVRALCGRMVAPRNVKVYNPAFDVTPNELITAIITEKGIFKKPYEPRTFLKARDG